MKQESDFKPLRETAKDIARHMPGYELAPDNHEGLQFCRLTRTENGITFEITLSTAHQRDRIQISGNWPRSRIHAADWYPREKTGSITVARDKDPQAIAKDMLRRFVPDFEAAFKTGVKERDDADKYETDSLALAVKLAKEVDGSRPFGHSPKQFSGGPNPYIEGRVNGPDSVDLHIRSMPPDIASAIIALVKQMRKKS